MGATESRNRTPISLVGSFAAIVTMTRQPMSAATVLRRGPHAKILNRRSFSTAFRQEFHGRVSTSETCNPFSHCAVRPPGAPTPPRLESVPVQDHRAVQESECARSPRPRIRPAGRRICCRRTLRSQPVVPPRTVPRERISTPSPTACTPDRQSPTAPPVAYGADECERRQLRYVRRSPKTTTSPVQALFVLFPDPHPTHETCAPTPDAPPHRNRIDGDQPGFGLSVARSRNPSKNGSP